MGGRHLLLLLLSWLSCLPPCGQQPGHVRGGSRCQASCFYRLQTWHSGALQWIRWHAPSRPRPHATRRR